MMQVTIIKPGLLSTVQDLGRHGYLAQAVPVSGVMDALSARIANMAIGNDDNDAVIEFTYADAVFKADTNLLIAYAGGGSTLKANGQLLPNNRPIFIPADTSIELVPKPNGCRTYLAIAGGWGVPEVMGSRSSYLTAGFGGFEGRALKARDVLNGADNQNPLTQKIFDRLKGDNISFPTWGLTGLSGIDRKTIRIVAGPEFNWFDGGSLHDLLNTSYRLGLQSNRMGYQLEGAPIKRIKADELLSTAVTPGTIQVTNSGALVLLMADCQTTGGYPRIGQVAAVDLPLCAQLKPGDELFFTAITRQEAEKLYLEREEDLRLASVAVELKYL